MNLLLGCGLVLLVSIIFIICAAVYIGPNANVFQSFSVAIVGALIAIIGILKVTEDAAKSDFYENNEPIVAGGGKHTQPSKNSRGEIVFADYPDFRPNLTPREIFERGSFGGTYWRPIYSSVTKKHYNDTLHHKFDFLKGLPPDKMTLDWEDYNANINKYKVKVGQTLEDWEAKGWITKYDPYGWVQWYCNFYNGRRCPDDERQIKRWEGLAGPKGRFRKWLITEIKKKGKGNPRKYKDAAISPAIRQTLQHWAYKLTSADYKADKPRKK